MASRILLADDSITIQKVVNLTFADEGIEVVAVSNGDLAERRLAEIGPDLVLADIFMPGKNGYELCEAIKENPQFRNVPVVLLVGAFEPFDQAEARRVKADAHLTKPFESRTLVETVRRLISASWRTTTGPIAPTSTTDDAHAERLEPHSAETTAAPLAAQLADKLDLSAMAATVAPSTPQVRNTGELASPSPDVRQDVLDLGVVDAPVPENISANLTDTSNRFEPLEFSQNGGFSPGEVAPSFDLDLMNPRANEEVQGFDSAEPIDVAPEAPKSFEGAQPSTLNDVDISGAGEGDHWFNTGSGFDPSRLDRPADDGAWRVPSNGSPLSYRSPDFSVQTETGFSVSEGASETACATLLAVDEPLGDVLFDEAGSATSLARLDMSESPGLELGEAETAEPELAVSTQFDLVEISESPAPETQVVVEENNAATEQFATEPVEQVTSGAFEVVAAPEAPISEAFELVETNSAEDSQPMSEEVPQDLDWTTPHAASYSTAQLDSLVMPVETAEYVAESPGGEDVQKPENPEDVEKPENTEEASFTTPATWTDEEARFTPIDIEAVAVEDAVAESPAAEELPTAGDAPFEAVRAEGTGGAEEAALSAAAIEAIVRRVVAEMSESVVREVAWEVVPDCVERVIEQLTRESLTKRA